MHHLKSLFTPVCQDKTVYRFLAKQLSFSVAVSFLQCSFMLPSLERHQSIIDEISPTRPLLCQLFCSIHPGGNKEMKSFSFMKA